MKLIGLQTDFIQRNLLQTHYNKTVQNHSQRIVKLQEKKIPHIQGNLLRLSVHFSAETL